MKPRTYHKFLGLLTPDQALIVFEAAYWVFQDGNLYESFCNDADIGTDVYRETFEKLTDFMNEEKVSHT